MKRTEALDKTPAVTVVVRCYNESKGITRLFEDLAQQTTRDFEIVVVDSGSDDGTVEFVMGEDARLVQIEKSDFSFGRSLNLGCEAARGDLLVFVSAHCYPMSRDWLENLVEDLTDPRVAAVYGKQRAPSDSHFSERQILASWFPDESIRYQDSPFSNNANCAIRRSVWCEFKYDEDLPGLEDVEWASRVMAEGWKINYRADAGVFHVHNESPTQVKRRYQREAITFQKVFPGEHFNVLDLLRLVAKNVFADWTAARAEGALIRNLWPISRFRVAQFAGTYKGFHTRWPGSSELKRRFYYPDFK